MVAGIPVNYDDTVPADGDLFLQFMRMHFQPEASGGPLAEREAP